MVYPCKILQHIYTGGKRGWPGDVAIIHFNVDKMAGLGWKASHNSEDAVRIAARRLIDQGI